jgi:hypothetical protein
MARSAKEIGAYERIWNMAILPGGSGGRGGSGGEVCATEASRSFGNLSPEFTSGGSKIRSWTGAGGAKPCQGDAPEHGEEDRLGGRSGEPVPYCELAVLSANQWRRGDFWFAQLGSVPARVLRGEVCRRAGFIWGALRGRGARVRPNWRRTRGGSRSGAPGSSRSPRGR